MIMNIKRQYSTAMIKLKCNDFSNSIKNKNLEL